MVCFTGSVDFFNQHQIAAYHPNSAAAAKEAAALTRHTKSAPSRSSSPYRMVNPPSPTVGRSNDLHWMSWNSGTPEPPGLQKRLHRPYPTPEPPRILGSADRCYSRGSRNGMRPATGTVHATGNTAPVPDCIGSEGVNPVITNAREGAFSPGPATLPVSELSVSARKRSAGNRLAFFV